MTQGGPREIEGDHLIVDLALPLDRALLLLLRLVDLVVKKLLPQLLRRVGVGIGVRAAAPAPAAARTAEEPGDHPSLPRPTRRPAVSPRGLQPTAAPQLWAQATEERPSSWALATGLFGHAPAPGTDPLLSPGRLAVSPRGAEGERIGMATTPRPFPTVRLSPSPGATRPGATRGEGREACPEARGPWLPPRRLSHIRAPSAPSRCRPLPPERDVCGTAGELSSQPWGGPRRVAEAAASPQAAEPALWGA